MRSRVGKAATLLLFGTACRAAHLQTSAEKGFNEYTLAVETRLAKQHGVPETYVALLNVEPAKRTDVLCRLRSGAVEVEPVNGGTQQISGGLLHHWRAATLVPGATPKHMLALLRDYNNFAKYYAPEVESARLVAANRGSDWVALRLKKQRIVTVVLDSEYEIRSGLTGKDCGYSFSRSTHIRQIDNPGTSYERRRVEGEDDGFLWRLNSYWSFIQVPDGLLIECEALSLTRDIPAGLDWLIAPVIEDLPRTSLAFTLTATRKALVGIAVEGSHQ